MQFNKYLTIYQTLNNYLGSLILHGVWSVTYIESMAEILLALIYLSLMQIFDIFYLIQQLNEKKLKMKGHYSLFPKRANALIYSYFKSLNIRIRIS